jgi:diguanylate cyclase (GGDEF)-like protein/PAS domain S-box-containing protein
MLEKIRKSLIIKVGIAAAALAFIVIMGAGMLSYRVAAKQLELMLRKEIEARSRIIATHIGNEMKNIVATLSDMAHNTLFANALADSGGRDNYLRPYLNSFEKVGNVPVCVVLCDFRGQMLSGNPIKAYTEPDMKMLRRAVDSGQPQLQIDSITNNVVITLSWPVLYANTGLPEGSLMYQFTLDAMSEDIYLQENNRKYRLFFSGSDKGEIYSIHQDKIPSEKALFSSTELPLPDIFKGWSLAVEVWEDDIRLKYELHQLATDYVIFGIIGLAVIIPLSLWGARRILSRLKALESVAGRVAQTKSLEEKFPQEGNDEIANIGQAFNDMLDELDKANQIIRSEANREMKRQSERFMRLLSVSLEGYVRIDMNTGRIENINDAFCRITGYDSSVQWTEQPIPEYLAEIITHAQSFPEKQAWTEEKEIVGPKGNRIAMLIHCTLDIDEDGNKQVIAFLTDITNLRAAEAEMRYANAQLVDSVSALKKRDNELTLLNRMNDILLASHKKEEVFEILRLTASKLFPGLSGGVAILSSDKQTLETIIGWGNQSLILPQFHLDECWAMRNGRLYEITNAAEGLICSHFKGKPKQGYVCLPLVVRGITIGLLWSELVGHDEAEMGSMRQLIISIGDAIKLNISNIELREALYEQTIRDPLTGLYNRRHFSDIIVRELSASKRYNKPLALAAIDLDFFKSVNDRFGHDAGDKVLREFGKLLREKTRASDIAFRFGGEEFVLLMSDTDEEGSFNCLENIRKLMEKKKIIHNGQALGIITMSAGIAQYPQHGEDGESLVRAADDALYSAKESGRNNVKLSV